MGLFGASRLHIVEPQKQKDKDKSVFGLFELLNQFNVFEIYNLVLRHVGVLAYCHHSSKVELP